MSCFSFRAGRSQRRLCKAGGLAGAPLEEAECGLHVRVWAAYRGTHVEELEKPLHKAKTRA